ncbi:Catenin alpha-2 isoform X1 [Aix galericulata]|nr:Catenin alpha-2 isoform X1 [Aix galericulata]
MPACFWREYDFCNVTYHSEMGPEKFGNQDSHSREATGATCYSTVVIFLLDEINFFQKQEDFKNGAQGDTISITTEDVTTLVNTSNKGPSGKKKGRSKKAHVLAASVEQATQNFLEKGDQIAKESQDLKEELVAAVEDVRKQGETMRIASSEFADDPCSSVKRGTMVRAARALLSAVTRLLILADMADVMRLLSHLKIVEEALEAVKNATNEQDLANRFKEFGKEMVKLNYVAARRQQELKDPHCRDEMAAARGALKKNATMLYTASQAFLRHPDVAATRANRDYVFKQVQEAIAGISNAAQATSPTDENKGHTGIGELAAALNEFDNKIILDPMTFSEARFRPSLEERLESIISGAALMADSSCTRDDRRERIVAECNAVRQALQDLLSEYMNNINRLLEMAYESDGHLKFQGKHFQETYNTKTTMRKLKISAMVPVTTL